MVLVWYFFETFTERQLLSDKLDSRSFTFFRSHTEVKAILVVLRSTNGVRTTWTAFIVRIALEITKKSDLWTAAASWTADEIFQQYSFADNELTYWIIPGISVFCFFQAVMWYLATVDNICANHFLEKTMDCASLFPTLSLSLNRKSCTEDKMALLETILNPSLRGKTYKHCLIWTMFLVQHSK